MADDKLHILATQLGAALKARGLILSMAESCTGGMVAQAVTSVAGSSAWFDRGFVTYSNNAKIEMLNVSQSTLENFGAVSEQTAAEMAVGALKNSNAHIAGSITGIAGPDGGSPEKPVGTVCFAWVGVHLSMSTCTKQFQGSRVEIRQQATAFMLAELIEKLAYFPRPMKY
ncbi:MAG: nicotinamide-nucleotide amidohydrolase family protein [Methylotenera sp.]|nr:nicotinamide-nucleotide amidohydrolase family protein [Methylotenera sp.]MDP1754280.1 nicotinamide-nucleotide amidohydrolase family protein [Methylotenera sp.]MDP1959782.1 nicotinamide-nucleotide amidohydrolase family protein [Methylotenera sp.]MDP3206443.1 nicotinamide-nucleotide amidohydrolase family protein [Methylotenera sp.]MDP3303259.1 nicotinamide-nucleotide amidohydrolase family protein [Methylotenera sp.]